jgi:Ca2+-binding EF-hand superfamily protein
MSKFSDKATANTTNVTVLEGRGGEELTVVARRLLLSLSITAEQVEDYYDAFTIFPLDRNKCVTMDAMKTFYKNAGLDLSDDDCENAIKAFTGNDLTFSLDFETYVINMERWARKVRVRVVLLLWSVCSGAF